MNAAEGLFVDLHQEAPIPLAASFSCAPGEILALVGPSGSGKSTILRSIAGVYRPNRGVVTVNGETWYSGAESPHLPAHKRKAGMVFQSYALFPHMSALGNLMAAMGHMASSQREARARKLLDLVHLAGLERRRPDELSGDSSSAWPLPGRLPATPRCCFSTNRFPRSTGQLGNASIERS